MAQHSWAPISIAGTTAPSIGRHPGRCVAVCGPRYAHQPARRASRAGHAPSEVVLGGRKVALRRPRVRLDGQEVALPSVQAFTNTDPLTWGTSRMLLKFSGGSVYDYATISDACRRTASRAAAKHPSSSPQDEPRLLGWVAAPRPSPSGAWRVRDHWSGSGVGSRIAVAVPQVYVWQAGVDASSSQAARGSRSGCRRTRSRSGGSAQP